MIYAQAHNRILIVDAVNAGQLQRLNDYFTIHISSARGIKFVNSLNACFPNIRSMTIFPDFKNIDFDSFFPVYDKDANAHIDLESKALTTFNFNKAYTQDILLHEQCGSGCSWNVFERLELTTSARNAIQERLSLLPPNYNAIHIRNTDLKTSYSDQINTLKPKLLSIGLPVLICTDDPSVLDHCKKLLTGIHVFSIYLFPRNFSFDGSASLHYNSSTRGWIGDIGLLSDLFALALSKELFILRLDNSFFSGFSLLAQDLHRRPWILDRLFSASHSLIRTT